MASDNTFNLERQLALTEAKFEILTARLEAIQKDADKNDVSTDSISKEINNLRAKVSNLESGINDIKAELSSLNSNVFLQFTNDIDLKKLITIILILSTAITSPTLVSSWLQIDTTGADADKLEKLIDLLEENAGN